MAQRTIVLLEDDLGGGDADETLTFGLDGRAYEIDLSTKNASALRKALAPYVAAARKVSNRSGFASRASRASADSGPDAATLRAWAIENGYEVNSRGRVSAAIRAAYESS
jgi:Lsr2